MTTLQIGKLIRFASTQSREKKCEGRSSRLRIACLIAAFCAAAAVASPAQTFTSLFSFNYTDGAIPFGLVQGTDGNLYGTTDKGGTGVVNGCNKSCGVLFKITTTGTETVVHNFDGTDGNGPTAVVQATNGTFYGTTSYGGAHDCISFGSSGGCGTVFKLVGTTLTTLYNFCAQSNCTDGAIPWGRMVQGTDGNIYGTSEAGGTGTCPGDIGPGCGTIFKITASTGALTTLHNFVNTDGAYPFGWLMLATNGSIYGTTAAGGANGYGTVFKITNTGTFSTVHNFTGTDGAYPFGGLVQASNGNFYGTTSELLLNGGAPDCSLTGIGYGTVFKMTGTGTVTTLHGFSNTDGAYPYTGLTLGTDGNFYGATACGGTNNEGVAFSMTPAGALTKLHVFSGTDGALPFFGMTQHTNGTFYGTTVIGGTKNDGTVFSVSMGLLPFVETRPTSGKVGSTVYILGTSLTSASSVTFNGVSATGFKIISSTEIKATVPTGATTGTVAVTTSQGTLKSNVPFRVTP